MKKGKGRGKRPGLRARSKNARLKRKSAVVTTTVRLPASAVDYVMEVAEIAEVPPSLVIAVLAATAIYQSRRVPIEELRQLKRAREVMEANDPGNALEIFGPPLNSKAEGQSPQAQFPVPDAGGAPGRAEDVYA